MSDDYDDYEEQQAEEMKKAYLFSSVSSGVSLIGFSGNLHQYER